MYADWTEHQYQWYRSTQFSPLVNFLLLSLIYNLSQCYPNMPRIKNIYNLSFHGFTQHNVVKIQLHNWPTFRISCIFFIKKNIFITSKLWQPWPCDPVVVVLTIYRKVLHPFLIFLKWLSAASPFYLFIHGCSRVKTQCRAMAPVRRTISHDVQSSNTHLWCCLYGYVAELNTVDTLKAEQLIISEFQYNLCSDSLNILLTDKR